MSEKERETKKAIDIEECANSAIEEYKDYSR